MAITATSSRVQFNIGWRDINLKAAQLPGKQPGSKFDTVRVQPDSKPQGQGIGKQANSSEVSETSLISVSKTTTKIEFQSIKLSENEEKYFTEKDLENLLPILQQADVNKDGVVSRNELKYYKNALLQEKSELQKMNLDKLVMDAVTVLRMKAEKENAIRKIDGQVQQIETVLTKDKAGVDVFEKLLPQIGEGSGLSIQKVIDIVSPEA